MDMMRQRSELLKRLLTGWCKAGNQEAQDLARGVSSLAKQFGSLLA